MKKAVILCFSILTGVVLNGQQIFTINSSGFTFSPANVIVNQGDIVRFNVGSSHPVVEVSQSTWTSNGATALPGGFSFPSGTGDFIAGVAGINYYVCSDHIGSGMKGTITVNSISGVNDSQIKDEIKAFPNPAQDYVILQSNSNLSSREIKILDLTGRVIKDLYGAEPSNGQLKISMENLIKGIYFILVKSDKGTVVLKILKS